MEFMEALKKFDFIFTLPAIITLSTLLKLTIDNFNMKEVEKKLLSNSKYFLINLSLILVATIVWSLLIGVMNTSFIRNDENYLDELFNLVVDLFPRSFIMFCILFICFYVFVYLINFKYNYFIKVGEKEKQKEWYLVRKLNKNILLLMDEIGNFRFLDYDKLPEETLYCGYVEKSQTIMSIYKYVYSNKKKLYYSLILSEAITYMLFFTFLMNFQELLSILSMGLFAIAFLLHFLVYIISKNMLYIQKLSKNSRVY